MSDDKPPDGTVFHVFDLFSEMRFEARLHNAWFAIRNHDHAVIVVIRSLCGPYKEARSTVNEGYLPKLKRLKDGEAKVIGTYEQMHNGNEAMTNALGRTERSSHQANKTGTGVLGGLEVRGIGGEYDGVEFSVGGGYTAAMREDMWADRDALVGKIVKVKYFASGSKDRPRFPVFLGMRDLRDL